jgi:tetratricopeptide (TPR) repeat protein
VLWHFAQRIPKVEDTMSWVRDNIYGRLTRSAKRGRMNKQMFGSGVVLAFLIAAASWAATATNPTSAAAPQPADPIHEQIVSKDPRQIGEAVETIWQQLQSANARDVSGAVVNMTRNRWMDDLMKAKRYDDVERLSLEAILVKADNITSIESLQILRVQALLKMGKTQEALAAAKGLFNVCQMKSTANSIQLLVTCLRAASPGDEGIVDRFRQEQLAGANIDEGRAKSEEQGKSPSSVLAGIKVDASIYQKGLQRYSDENFWSWTALGNLSLLADKPKEAQPLFERAYSVAKTNELAWASASIARCMRAEDGAIGRANAWALSIRP